MHKMPGACTLYVPLASLRLDVSDVEPAYRFHHPRPQISEQHICKHKTVAGHRQVPLHANPDIACKRMLYGPLTCNECVNCTGTSGTSALTNPTQVTLSCNEICGCTPSASVPLWNVKRISGDSMEQPSKARCVKGRDSVAVHWNTACVTRNSRWSSSAGSSRSSGNCTTLWTRYPLP